MAPRYLDWNGNGRIDPVDIGVSVSVDDEQPDSDIEEAEKPQGQHVQASGCLSSALVALSVIIVLGLLSIVMS